MDLTVLRSTGLGSFLTSPACSTRCPIRAVEGQGAASKHAPVDSAAELVVGDPQRPCERPYAGVLRVGTCWVMQCGPPPP